MTMRPRVLTWHTHGNYLLYLSQANLDFFLPVSSGGEPGYGGRGSTFPFGPNVHDCPVDQLDELKVDCILYQTRAQYEVERHRVLSESQRRLPQIVLEHEGPSGRLPDTRHYIDDPDVLLVHVTHFNELMWDCGRTPTRVVEHGVFIPPGIRCNASLARGVAAVNHLGRRGRALGADVFERAAAEVAIDLVGMESETLGGVGEVSPPDLPAFLADYRFYFQPARYSSLSLAMIEAMLVGLPVVAVASTEVATLLEEGRNGFVSTNVQRLIDAMKLLIADPVAAREVGERGRRLARERFDIRRFARDWECVVGEVIGRSPRMRRSSPLRPEAHLEVASS